MLFKKSLPVKGSTPNPWLPSPEPGMYRPAPENTGGIQYKTHFSLYLQPNKVCVREYTPHPVFISDPVTCEGVCDRGGGWPKSLAFSVFDDEISHLIQEHGAQVILLQEVVSY